MLRARRVGGLKRQRNTAGGINGNLQQYRQCDLRIEGSGTTAGTSAATESTASASAPAAGAAKPITRAEVEAIVAKIEADRGVKYNWRQSIVDLMKLLDLDSSLAARKELAQELGYKGALDGSAEMNRLAAQAGDGQGRRGRRQGAGQPERLKPIILG